MGWNEVSFRLFVSFFLPSSSPFSTRKCYISIWGADKKYSRCINYEFIAWFSAERERERKKELWGGHHRPLEATQFLFCPFGYAFPSVLPFDNIIFRSSFSGFYRVAIWLSISSNFRSLPLFWRELEIACGINTEREEDEPRSYCASFRSNWSKWNVCLGYTLTRGVLDRLPLNRSPRSCVSRIGRDSNCPSLEQKHASRLWGSCE